MYEIIIDKNPSQSKLKELKVESWPIWEKEVSTFPWTYDEQEMCYFLEGEVVVTPQNGKPVTIEKGNLVTFPNGMSCTWNVKKAIRKHYKFG